MDAQCPAQYGGSVLSLAVAPTLPALLEQHAATRGDHSAIRFLQRGEAVTEQACYAELHAAVTTMAGRLYQAGLADTPVVLALPPGLPFVVTLLACLRAGAIAVPIPFPPTGDEARRRLALMVADLGAGSVIGPADHGIDMGALRPVDPAAMTGDGVDVPLPDPDAAAVIQYSSGSTQAPRGMVISHRNIMANQAMIGQMFGSGPDIVAVNWLPPHHDMGLFGALLHPLYAGGTAVLMPPFAFIQKPLRWLKAISDHQGTTAGGPNFGYDLCVRRITPAQAGTLDLSTLKVAFCGAEPVRLRSLNAFADRLAPARFDPAAFLPCYGLAEATLLATSTRWNDGAPVAVPGVGRAHVSCGWAPDDAQVRICDPQDGRPLPDGERGEICIAGPHVAMGLWSGREGRVVPLPELREDEDGTGWLPTGDVGSWAADGLVILDRIKDCIIVHGRNIHAADAEAAALDVDGPPLLAVAAVGITVEDEEQLLLLCEVARNRSSAMERREWARVVAQQVGERCALMPQIVFVGSGALPRTTSGKIRRQAARAAYQAGEIKALVEGDM